jgi:protein CpxP
MKKTAIVLITALGLGSTLFASGFGGHCKHHMPQKEQMFKVMKQLDLTDAQKDALKELRASHKAERKAFKEAMKEKRIAQKGMGPGKMDMSQFMSATHFDMDAFKKAMKIKMENKIERMQKNMDRKVERRAAHMQKVFTILTPEQREKWIQLTKI